MTEKISEFRRRMDDGSTLVLVPHKAESAVKDSEGQTITLTYATKSEVQSELNKTVKLTASAQTITGDVTITGTVTAEKANMAGVTVEKVGTRAGIRAGGMTVSSGVIIANGNEETLQIQNTGYDLQQCDTDQVDKGSRITFYGKGGTGVNDRLGLFRIYNRKNGHNTIYISPFGLDENGALFSDGFTVNIQKDKTSWCTVPTVPSNAGSQSVVNKAYVEATDSSTNNLVHKSADERITGRKTFAGQPVFEASQYPLWHCVETGHEFGSTETYAMGLQVYKKKGTGIEYQGRACWTNTNNKLEAFDLRVNSNKVVGNHARLYIEEKEGGTFALSFWNGQSWTRLVQ